jgi:hypothetical protein
MTVAVASISGGVAMAPAAGADRRQWGLGGWLSLARDGTRTGEGEKGGATVLVAPFNGTVGEGRGKGGGAVGGGPEAGKG